MVPIHSTRTNGSAEPQLTVVGIGASVGGLEALTQLLRHLPATTGMAYVLVHHPGPTGESDLVRSLRLVTTMPVLEAVANAVLQPDHVYVAPPDAKLSIHQGALRVAQCTEGGGNHLLIDHFLCSLAEDRGAQAIGVILSGIGCDGTYGARAIRAHGGITMAQDATANYSGMPRSAIDSGSIDYTLSPEGIVDELCRVSRHSYTRIAVCAPANTNSTAEDDALRTLFCTLQRAKRVDYADYQRPTIIRRISRRMMLRRLERFEDYVALATSDSNELEALHHDLLFHSTRFFRDPAVFETLERRFIPALVQRHQSDKPFRLWVPGCSTGEDAYSVAICLSEVLRAQARDVPVKLFATDLAASVLETARAGWYPESIAADMSRERLKRYFIKVDGGYQVEKSVRDLCVFAQHNMSCDPPFLSLDLISCKGTISSLEPAMQKRALVLFHHVLNDGGALVLGSSETLGAASDLFAAADSKHRIYTKKPNSSGTSLILAEALTGFGTQPPRAIHPTEPSFSHEIQREFERAILKEYAPAGVLVDEDGEIQQFHGHTGMFLSPAEGVASMNLFGMAGFGLLVDMRAAIDEVKQTGSSAFRQGLRVRTNGHDVDVNLRVMPLSIRSQRRFAVMFERASQGTAGNRRTVGELHERNQRTPALNLPLAISGDDNNQFTRAQIEAELARTQAHLGSIIEELESSNKALRSANEATQTANENLQGVLEELQCTLEELQVSNQELTTVNWELQRRIREATLLSDDLSNLFCSVAIPIVMVGRDLRIKRYSPSSVEVFDLSSADIGCVLTNVACKLVGVDLMSHVLAVQESSGVYAQDVRDRFGCWRHLCIRPYRTAQNQIDGAVISVFDVHELKCSEQQFEAARVYAESIIATVQIPLVVLNKALYVVSANRAFLEMFGSPPNEIEDRPLREVTGQFVDGIALVELLRNAIDRDQPFSGLVTEHELPTIGFRKLLLNGRRLLQQVGKPELVLLAIEDITERAQLENDLRQAQRLEAIGRLSAGIAHDFNNLMTIIIASASALLAMPMPEASMAEMLHDIVKTSDRASTLTRQLMALSRNQLIAPKELDLNALVMDTQRMLSRLMGEQIHLATHLESDVGCVLADSALIAQALMNLAINARDAMDQGGGELTIETRNVEFDQPAVIGKDVAPIGPYVCLAVRDNGAGMDARTLKQIFEPFFTTKKSGAGTGLGLASVYGSIKQSGGFIDVKSTPGKGSTFSILLPRLAGARAKKSTPPAAGSIPPGADTILLVENNEDIRRLIKQMLDSAGYKVLHAEDGRAALEVARSYSGPIHLMISDVVMPAMGGSELADLMAPHRPDMKSLLISGYAPDIDAEAAAVKRAFLPKPFTPTVLAHKIREVLGD